MRRKGGTMEFLTAALSGPVCTRWSETSEVKPTFEICTSVVLDSMKLLTTAHVLPVDRRRKFCVTEFCPRYFESVPDFRPMHTKFERLLSKSVTTLEVMTYDLVVHTGPE